MQYLLSKIAVFKKELVNKQLFIFLDYDGTIVPVADNPDKAVLSQRMKTLLSDLAGLESVTLAIVSGRSLKNIKKMVNLKGIIYSGNHGLEIEGHGIDYTVKVPPITLDLMQSIKKVLSFKFDSIHGMFIEDKTMAIALHFRNADPGMLSVIRGYFNYIVQPYIMANKVDVLLGKMVYEIRPHVDWNKGNAVMWLISKIKKETGKEPLPIYVGDDITDESVFKCLENTGITVFVGEHKKTTAKHYLKDTGEVYETLKEIKNMLTDK